MSSLARQLLGATGALTTVTGSVFGSGSLAIPSGVVLVTLAGQGGTGGDNSYYNPGQPYVEPAVGQPYIAPYLYWQAQGVNTGGTFTTDPGLPYSDPGPGAVTFAYDSKATSWQGGSPGAYTQYTQGYICYQNPGQPYIAATAGQPYIAPTSGGGVYSGGNTTATLNGVTDTWTGGYGGAATSSVQTLVSTGAGQTLAYSIASGGSLNYSYTY